MAFFSLGRPFVGEYWLHSTRSRADLAASRMNLGGLYPKNPWPMLMMGWFGEAVAASLMMDLSRFSYSKAAHSSTTRLHLTKHPASGRRRGPRA